MFGYFVAIQIFILYWICVHFSKNFLERHGITVVGPILLLKTSRGLGFLEKLKKHRNFWRAYATFSYPFIFAAMGIMVFFIFLGIYNFLFLTPEPSPLTEPRNIFLIPGINIFIPVLWGWIGLIIAVVVHEFSHAILCRVEDIDVKSVGPLFILLPLGAFTEPDEEKLKVAGKPARRRIFAAGSMGNWIVAFIAFLLFFLLIYSISPIAEGIPVVETVEGYPAAEAGMEGEIIVAINGTRMKKLDDFFTYMRASRPGDELKIEMYGRELNIVLASSPNNTSRGLLGVKVAPGTGELLDFLRGIPPSLLSYKGWLLLLIPPVFWFGGFEPIMQFYKPVGPAEMLGDGVFYLANAFLWIGWINFFIGVFNSFPALPFDGGQISRDLLESLTERLKLSKEVQESISRGIPIFFLLLLISLIIMAVFLPPIVHGTP